VREAARLLPKVLSRFIDSSFCHEGREARMYKSAHAEQTNNRAADSRRTQDPDPRMPSKPFIGQQFFCPLCQGNRPGPPAEQIKFGPRYA